MRAASEVTKKNTFLKKGYLIISVLTTTHFQEFYKNRVEFYK